jgi:hypothetical protein
MTILELRKLIDEVELLEDAILNGRNWDRNYLKREDFNLGRFEHDSTTGGISKKAAADRIEYINYLTLDVVKP